MFKKMLENFEDSKDKGRLLPRVVGTVLGTLIGAVIVSALAEDRAEIDDIPFDIDEGENDGES